MAYNPYMQNYASPAPDILGQYKMPYQQQYTPQMPQAPQQPSPAAYNSPICWVLDEVEAVSYPVFPNCTVTLWDKNQPTIYVKSVNAQGVPSMRILDFTERTAGAQAPAQKHECTCGKDFVKNEDFNALREEFSALKQQVSALSVPAAKSAKKEKEGNE